MTVLVIEPITLVAEPSVNTGDLGKQLHLGVNLQVSVTMEAGQSASSHSAGDFGAHVRPKP